MASADSSTSSTTSTTSTTAHDHKRTVDEAFLHKMKSLVERLRLDNAALKKSLDAERSGIRSLIAQHEAAVRNLNTEYKKREEALEKQLRTSSNRRSEQHVNGNKLAELKKLTLEIQLLKTANKNLQEKLKVAVAAESARTAELRALAARRDEAERVVNRAARAQGRQLLEEIKSKERVIAQLRREARRAPRHDQVQKMDEPCRRVSADLAKEKTNREDLKTGIQHRKETFYREQTDEMAPSPAPAPLSPAPSSLGDRDVWTCSSCAAAEARAERATREAARLAGALCDARDHVELLEFRLLELEDAQPDKCVGETLTDSDSGCVSPGSRIQHSASPSPDLKRTDSGCPASPTHPRRQSQVEDHDHLREQFANTQILQQVLDHATSMEMLRQMWESAGDGEDRRALERVLHLLRGGRGDLHSIQTKPSRTYEHTPAVPDEGLPSLKPVKAVATVSPYQQGCRADSLDSLCEDRKPSNLLQESGIFEGTETESKSTQTDNENFDGELNTEIQRLNSIREKLEKKGVRSRTLNAKEDTEGLECGCVRLGKKHQQYYERRLRFLEGKVAIYEAASDVRDQRLADRLQREHALENRIQELESQLSQLQDKYERLEEECCELEEIENDTRLHWQQLEMEYELSSAQLRDMTEQREVSRAQASRLAAALQAREDELHRQEKELRTRLSQLERAVPALIAWNVVRAAGGVLSAASQRELLVRIGPLNPDTRALVARGQHAGARQPSCTDLVVAVPPARELELKITKLLAEKRQIEETSSRTIATLSHKVAELEEQLSGARRQLAAARRGAAVRRREVQREIEGLEGEVQQGEQEPASSEMVAKLKVLRDAEQSLRTRVAELERREAAYLDMLTQADDMWADMEGQYRRRIHEATQHEDMLRSQVKKLESEKRTCVENIKMKLREVEESESVLRVALEKTQRDAGSLRERNQKLAEMYSKADADNKKSEAAIKTLESKFNEELEQLRKVNKRLGDDLQTHKQVSKKSEMSFMGDLDSIRKELNRTTKINQDLEVTNGELKEEVEALERQLSLTQKALSQCKRKCDEKVNTLSHELSIKVEELEELRSEIMRRALRPAPSASGAASERTERTEYVDEPPCGVSYVTSRAPCSCPALRNQLIAQLIEDLFARLHDSVDDELAALCEEIAPTNARRFEVDTKAKITNYLLMAISKELVRSIGDADAKTDSEEWRRTVSHMAGQGARRGTGRGADVARGAARLASLACACAAAALTARAPLLATSVRAAQEEVLEHGDVRIMQEQLASAVETIVNCPSCALGTNTIVWSTDV